MPPAIDEDSGLNAGSIPLRRWARQLEVKRRRRAVDPDGEGIGVSSKPSESPPRGAQVDLPACRMDPDVWKALDDLRHSTGRRGNAGVRYTRGLASAVSAIIARGVSIDRR